MGQPAFRHKQVWAGGVLAVLSASILVCTYLWMTSRTLVALQTPISLARGEIRSQPFKINLPNDYTVKIDAAWESYFDPNCPPYKVRARWMVYKDGAVYVHWTDTSDPSSYLSDFRGQDGTYELRLEILSDTACLNPGHPRLLVYTEPGEYQEWVTPVLWSSAFAAALGMSLVILGFMASGLSNRSTRITEFASVAQCFQWAQKLPLKRQFQSPPAFALLAAPVLMFVVIIGMILVPLPPLGLYVQVLQPGHSAGEQDALAVPITVCIADAGRARGPTLYVNSKPTSWERLQSALRDQLKLRPTWVVYVEAEPDVAWAYPVAVADIVKGLRAKVVLLDMNNSQCTRADLSRH